MKSMISVLSVLAVFGVNSACAAELYLKVNRNGSFSVAMGSIYHMNTGNVFKLFDIKEGTSNLQVVDNATGNSIYSGTINLFKDQRTIAEIDNNGNLFIVKNVPITYENWYTEKCPAQANTPAPITVVENNLTAARYNEILESVSKESFQKDKLERAKTSIASYTLTVEQVKGIMGEMAFDDEKVDFAKYAYNFTSDKDRYDKVADGVTFSSKKKELLDFIKKQPKK